MNTLLHLFAVQQAMREQVGPLTGEEAAARWRELDARWTEYARPWKGYLHWSGKLLHPQYMLDYRREDLFRTIAGAPETAPSEEEPAERFKMLSGRNKDALTHLHTPRQIRTALVRTLPMAGVYRQLEQDVSMMCDFLVDAYGLDLSRDSIQNAVEEKRALLALDSAPSETGDEKPERIPHRHTMQLLHAIRHLETLTPEIVETLWRELQPEFPAAWTHAQHAKLTDARRNAFGVIAGLPPEPLYQSIATPPLSLANRRAAEIECAIARLDDAHFTIPNLLRHLASLSAVGTNPMQDTKRDLAIICDFLDRKFNLGLPAGLLADALLSMNDQLRGQLDGANRAR